MKKTILILLSIILIASCRKEKEVILSKHENGQIHEIITYQLPITDDSIGIKRLFYENGKLQCKGGYRKGKRHGKWKCENRNGEINWEGNYNNGIENGEFYCRYEDGSWRKFNSENGKRIGETVEYNFDSTINNFVYVYGQYENDLETGVWSWQDILGRKMQEMNFEKGINSGYVAFYYPNGNIKIKGEGFVKEGEEFGLFKDTLFYFNEYENGKIDSIEIYKDGVRQEKINF